MKSLFSSSHARPTVLFRLHRPYITEICVFFFLLLLSCTPMIRTQGSLSAPMCPLVSHPPAVVCADPVVCAHVTRRSSRCHLCWLCVYAQCLSTFPHLYR
ncbi:hypothetical protein B0H11DRAFT_2035830, partial [Mycena galericulata]